LDLLDGLKEWDNPFGDGTSGKKIVKILREQL
jgi:UDP-N-acetylglucosamine 2-epimerase